jgi:hypothetical protein
MPEITEGRENITLNTHNPEILLHVRSKTFYPKIRAHQLSIEKNGDHELFSENR